MLNNVHRSYNVDRTTSDGRVCRFYLAKGHFIHSFPTSFTDLSTFCFTKHVVYRQNLRLNYNATNITGKHLFLKMESD